MSDLTPCPWYSDGQHRGCENAHGPRWGQPAPAPYPIPTPPTTAAAVTTPSSLPPRPTAGRAPCNPADATAPTGPGLMKTGGEVAAAAPLADGGADATPEDVPLEFRCSLCKEAHGDVTRLAVVEARLAAAEERADAVQADFDALYAMADAHQRENVALRERAERAERELDAMNTNCDSALKAAKFDRARAEAAEARCAEMERTLSEAKAVALGGDGMTHEQALAAVVGLVANLRDERARCAELERERDGYLNGQLQAQEACDALMSANRERTAQRDEARASLSRCEEGLRAFPAFQIGQLRHLYANAAKGHYDGNLLSHAIAALESWNDAMRAALATQGDGTGGAESGPETPR